MCLRTIYRVKKKNSSKKALVENVGLHEPFNILKGMPALHQFKACVCVYQMTLNVGSKTEQKA